MTLREDLYDAVARGARELLRADACEIYRLDVEADELSLVALRSRRRARAEHRARRHRPGARPDATATAAGQRAPQSRARCGPTSTRAALLVAPLVARDEQLGCSAAGARSAVHRRGRRAARRRRRPDGGRAEEGGADRAADRGEHRQGHVRRARRGSVEAAEAKASEAGCDLGRPHLFLHAERGPGADEEAPTWPELAARLEARLRRLYPRAFFDARHDRVRALVPSRRTRDGAAEARRAECDSLGARRARCRRPQRRRPRRGERPAPDARGRRRRADRPLAGRRRRRRVATSSSGRTATSSTCELDDAPRDRYRQLGRAAERVRPPARVRLVETLERFLADRGSVTASARALYVHPNTVRQRLERIERVAEPRPSRARTCSRWSWR